MYRSVLLQKMRRSVHFALTRPVVAPKTDGPAGLFDCAADFFVGSAVANLALCVRWAKIAIHDPLGEGRADLSAKGLDLSVGDPLEAGGKVADACVPWTRTETRTVGVQLATLCEQVVGSLGCGELWDSSIAVDATVAGLARVGDLDALLVPDPAALGKTSVRATEATGRGDETEHKHEIRMPNRGLLTWWS